jgi:DNA-binding XRE family transcriptional regulator
MDVCVIGVHLGITVDTRRQNDDHCGMVDAGPAQRRGTSDRRPTLQRTVYLAVCAERGALRQEDRAELFGMDRRALNRYENDKVQPLLSTALRIAAKLEKPVEELWKPAA